jgi:hypothetical protein
VAAAVEQRQVTRVPLPLVVVVVLQDRFFRCTWGEKMEEAVVGDAMADGSEHAADRLTAGWVRPSTRPW